MSMCTRDRWCDCITCYAIRASDDLRARLEKREAFWAEQKSMIDAELAALRAQLDAIRDVIGLPAGVSPDVIVEGVHQVRHNLNRRAEMIGDLSSHLIDAVKVVVAARDWDDFRFDLYDMTQKADALKAALRDYDAKYPSGGK